MLTSGQQDMSMKLSPIAHFRHDNIWYISVFLPKKEKTFLLKYFKLIDNMGLTGVYEVDTINGF